MMRMAVLIVMLVFLARFVMDVITGYAILPPWGEPSSDPSELPFQGVSWGTQPDLKRW